MQEYNTIIGKLLSGINRKKFKRIVDKYKGDFAVKKLTCWEQFVSVFLGQITESETLREIVDLIKFHSNQKSLIYLLIALSFIVAIPNESCAKFKPTITVEQMREVNAYGDAIETAIAKRQYFRASQIAEQFIKKYPNEPDALFAMAKTSYYSGDSEKAIEYYTKCYKLDNTYYHAVINRGFVKYQNKDYKGAIKDYTKAINMKYDNTSMAQAYGNRAIAKYFAGDLKSALKDYDKVFELEPNLPNIDQIHFNRGLCRYDLGDKAGADEDYKTARKLNPKRKYIYYDKRG